jgi:hypothetical protein
MDSNINQNIIVYNNKFTQPIHAILAKNSHLR